jgi:hypothetical protein
VNDAVTEMNDVKEKTKKTWMKKRTTRIQGPRIDTKHLPKNGKYKVPRWAIDAEWLVENGEENEGMWTDRGEQEDSSDAGDSGYDGGHNDNQTNKNAEEMDHRSESDRELKLESDRGEEDSDHSSDSNASSSSQGDEYEYGHNRYGKLRSESRELDPDFLDWETRYNTDRYRSETPVGVFSEE